MLKIKTLIGTKIASIKECLKLKKIIEEISVVSEDFWDHEDAELILDEFPTLKIPCVPQELVVKHSQRSTLLKHVPRDCAFKIGTHVMNRHWLKELDIECPYCRGYNDHPHCSPDGICEYSEFHIAKFNSPKTYRRYFTQLFRKTKQLSLRETYSALRPEYNPDSRRFYDSFRVIIVNGTKIRNGSVKQVSNEISNNMLFPWNNPLLVTTEKCLWARFFEFRNKYRARVRKGNKRPLNDLFGDFVDELRKRGKTAVYINRLRILEKYIQIENLPEIFEESLRDFAERYRDLEPCTISECRHENDELYTYLLVNRPVING